MPPQLLTQLLLGSLLVTSHAGIQQPSRKWLFGCGFLRGGGTFPDGLSCPRVSNKTDVVHSDSRIGEVQQLREMLCQEGKFVGTDQMGNKYYENKNYIIGRSRWVEYNINVRWDYDASQVSPEWFGWLHYKTDCVPCCDEAKYQLSCCSWSHRWLLPPEENTSGTCRAFYPYSTQKAHILPWDGNFRLQKEGGS